MLLCSKTSACIVRCNICWPPSTRKTGQHRSQMIMSRILIAAIFSLAAVVTLTVAGRAEPPVGGATRYTSAQAISHSFGSKRAVGYFAAQDGNCALTMFLAEA